MSNMAYIERYETKRMRDGATNREVRFFADNVDVSFSLCDSEKDLQGLDLLDALLEKQCGEPGEDNDSEIGDEYNEDVENLLLIIRVLEMGITIEGQWFSWDDIKETMLKYSK